MSKTELRTLRANILGGMDSYVREVINDEDIFDYWLVEGVPDECSEDFLMEIAKDEHDFNRICYVFSKVIDLNT